MSWGHSVPDTNIGTVKALAYNIKEDDASKNKISWKFVSIEIFCFAVKKKEATGEPERNIKILSIFFVGNDRKVRTG